MANHFTVTIPAKPYVKAFLENNCGIPVDLKNIPEIQAEFIRALEKKPMRRETDDIAKWPEKVTIIIPPDSFYRHGWEMNKTNISSFNKFVEHRIKFIMRSYISMNRILGIPVASCIRDFQSEYNFPEPIWAYDSIKKDYDRHARNFSFDKKPMISVKQKLREILMSNLSEMGTIGRKQKEVCHG